MDNRGSNFRVEAVNTGPRPINFSRPSRVWINCPSTLQPYHHLHGKRAIVVPEQGDSNRIVTIWFTEGPTHSTRIETLYLSEAE